MSLIHTSKKTGLLNKEKEIRQYMITTIIGVGLCMSGFVQNRFLLFRPNRIMDGTAIRLQDIIEANPGLFMSLLGILIVLVVIRALFHMPWFLYSIYVESMILVVLLSTGRLASQMALGYSSAARTSLGPGFWLCAIGLTIILESTLHYDGKMHMHRAFLTYASLLLGIGLLQANHSFRDIGIVKEIMNHLDQFSNAFVEHLILVLGASGFGLLIGLFLSFLAYRSRGRKPYILGLCNMAQVIPTLSMLGLLMIPLTLLSQRFELLRNLGIQGIGFFPAFLVLTSYTLLPIVNSTLSGLESIHPDILFSAQAMGMEKPTILRRIEIPLTLPYIMTGFKLAIVQSVGNAILAGLVGGGGLGGILFLGLAQSAPDMIVASSIAIVFLALILNGILSFGIERINGNWRSQ